MGREPIPGSFLVAEGDSPTWAGSLELIKRRHFLIEGQTLKLFGRRGRTYKGRVDLLSVVALKPCEDETAPPNSLELQVRASRTRQQTMIIAPDHSADELFFGLGNAVPTHVTAEQLWRMHMGSRPAVPTEGNPREYRIGKTLGTGTFGKVKLATRSDGEQFACKCLNRNRLENACQSGRLAKEIRLLKMLCHPNVIKLHEVLHTPTEILMVMEYVDGGDLLEVLNTRSRFTEDEVRHIFCQICSGVSFCHSLGVAHRDLKPENILIGKRTLDGNIAIKVADFGLSTLMRTDEMLSTACGSPHYVAPEILTFDGTAQYDGLLSDVWSLGVMLHVMLLYRLPFEADSTQLLYKKIRQGLPPLPDTLSPAASSLLQGMLTVSPLERMTLVQVVQHEWPQLAMHAGKADVPLPLFVSQTVDAVVDNFSIVSPNGSETYLSSSQVFKIGSDPSSTSNSDGDGVGREGGMRRAFTFDVLPQPSGEDNVDEILFHPTDKEGRRRAARRRGTGTAAAAAAFQLSPRVGSSSGGGGGDGASPMHGLSPREPPVFSLNSGRSPPTAADVNAWWQRRQAAKRPVTSDAEQSSGVEGDGEFSQEDQGSPAEVM